jgi:hypothetical protein
MEAKPIRPKKKTPPWKRRKVYAMSRFEEYKRLMAYTHLIYSMGIIEKEQPGVAFKVLAEIILNTDGLITEGMLEEYKKRNKKKLR